MCRTSELLRAARRVSVGAYTSEQRPRLYTSGRRLPGASFRMPIVTCRRYKLRWPVHPGGGCFRSRMRVPCEVKVLLVMSIPDADEIEMTWPGATALALECRCSCRCLPTARPVASACVAPCVALAVPVQSVVSGCSWCAHGVLMDALRVRVQSLHLACEPLPGYAVLGLFGGCRAVL